MNVSNESISCDERRLMGVLSLSADMETVIRFALVGFLALVHAPSDNLF